VSNSCAHCGEIHHEFVDLQECYEKKLSEYQQQRDVLAQKVTGLQDQLAASDRKWWEYEREHILPCFEKAKKIGMDLQTRVHENPEKCSTAIFVDYLLQRLDSAIEIGNRNADQELRNLQEARRYAALVATAERGRTVAECLRAEFQDFLRWATADQAWQNFLPDTKKRWIELTTAADNLDEMAPVYKAERAMIKALLALDRCASEFEGDLKACSEHLDFLWTCVEKYRNLKLPVVMNP
jgi:hypothetical protein